MLDINILEAPLNYISSFNEWIPNVKNKLPNIFGAIVDIKLRNGIEKSEVKYNEWDWEVFDGRSDIINYRIRKL